MANQNIEHVAGAPSSALSGTLRGLRWYICGLLFFVTFINYVDRVSLGAMAPILQKAIGWDNAEFAWINFSFTLSYAVGFPIAGRFLDRVGVRKGLALGVLVWSLAAASHSFAASAWGFAFARLILGLGEATNFPACIKAIAEWFPKRERALATGIFNTGTNFAAMLQGVMLALAAHMGWQWVFITIGLLGALWLAVWLKFYRTPEEHPNLSAAEAALIREDHEPPPRALDIPWQSLLRYREAWAFLIGKLLSDPVWWFYLTWLPSYLKAERNVSLTSAAGALAAIYLAADFGSIVGGWFPGFLMRRGVSAPRARSIGLLTFAMGLPISALAVTTQSLWAAVALISVATACHQGWSANLFTVASDAFPKRAVGSVVGFGGMCGGIGGMFMNLISGLMLQWVGHYTPLFIFAGVMHPLAWIAIRVLTRGNIQQVDLDNGIRGDKSPVLLGMGAVLLLIGAVFAIVVGINWDYLVTATNSKAAAAGGAAVGGILAVLGALLVYASRPQVIAADA